MINFSSIESLLCTKEKKTWGLLSNLVSIEQQERLCNLYPKQGFSRCFRDHGEKKHYSFNLLELVHKNSFKSQSTNFIDNIWFNLAEELLSADYIYTISQRLSITLKDCDVNIGFYKFDPGDWVAPHLDNEDKILTQIFYFNSFWSAYWGGYFLVLDSQNETDINFSVPPLSNFSVLIARSETAWHMVTPVSPLAKECRLSMQLEFIRRA